MSTIITLIVGLIGVSWAFSKSPKLVIPIGLICIGLASWHIYQTAKPVQPAKAVLALYEADGSALADAALSTITPKNCLVIAPLGSPTAELRLSGIKKQLQTKDVHVIVKDYDNTDMPTIPLKEYNELIKCDVQIDTIISLSGLPSPAPSNGQRLFAYSRAGSPDLDQLKNSDVKAVAWYEEGKERPIFSVKTLP